MKGGAGRPSCNGAADGPPRRDDDVDAAVGVRVLGVRIGSHVRGARGPVLILPHHQGFVERVKAMAGGAVERPQRKRLLVALRVGECERERVGDAAGIFERGDHGRYQVLRCGFGRVRQDDVGVAAFGFAASVSAYDDAFEFGVCEVTCVACDGGRDGLDFLSRDFQLEFVVEFHSDSDGGGGFVF